MSETYQVGQQVTPTKIFLGKIDLPKEAEGTFPVVNKQGEVFGLIRKAAKYTPEQIAKKQELETAFKEAKKKVRSEMSVEAATQLVKAEEALKVGKENKYK